VAAADLAANHKQCSSLTGIIRPYTRRGHDSDGELDLIDMRQNFCLLESHVVDLVLTAKPQLRTLLLHQRPYGLSATFGEAMKSSPVGRRDDTGVTSKPTVGPNANRGGFMWWSVPPARAPPARSIIAPMFFLRTETRLDGAGHRRPWLEAKFLRETGAIDTTSPSSRRSAAAASAAR